jgi:hypothetical protein
MSRCFSHFGLYWILLCRFTANIHPAAAAAAAPAAAAAAVAAAAADVAVAAAAAAAAAASAAAAAAAAASAAAAANAANYHYILVCSSFPKQNLSRSSRIWQQHAASPAMLNAGSLDEIQYLATLTMAK